MKEVQQKVNKPPQPNQLNKESYCLGTQCTNEINTRTIILSSEILLELRANYLPNRNDKDLEKIENFNEHHNCTKY